LYVDLEEERQYINTHIPQGKQKNRTELNISFV